MRHHADSRRDSATLLGHWPHGSTVTIREPDLTPPELFASAKIRETRHVGDLDGPPQKLEETSRLPSGPSETSVTQSLWPMSVRLSCPVARSQILTVLSALPAARR